MDFKKQNPFYDNHVFKKEDLDRAVIKKWQYPILFLLPTYIQLADGYVAHYKLWQGRIFLMKMEKTKHTI